MTAQAQCSAAAKSLIDMQGSLITVMTDSTHAVRLLAKHRPGVPILVLTQRASVGSQCALIHGAVPVVLAEGGRYDEPEGKRKLTEMVSHCRWLHRQQHCKDG